MKTLLVDDALPTDAAYRRFVRRVQVAAQFPDTLAAGRPYLGLDGLLLDDADHALLRRLSERFARAFEWVARSLVADVPGLIELGFPWMAAELLAVEPPRQPILGRFDFVQDRGGRWWLLEFNADTPSGVREAIAADRVAYQLLPTADLDRPNAELSARLIDAFRRALSGLPAGAALGIVTSAGELEDVAQMAFTRDLVRPVCEELGLEVVFGDIDNLALGRRGPLLRSRTVHALYRYVPFESILGMPAFLAMYDPFIEGRLRLLNGLFGLLLQNKGLLARVWERREDPELTAAERQAIANHLPPTWMIADCPSNVERRDLVVKQVFGREGEEVFFGDELADDRWQELRRRRTYVVQQRVDLCPVSPIVPGLNGCRRRAGHVTIGSYVVDGRWAGYYSRFGGRIITNASVWLPVYVWRGGGGS